VKRLLGYFGDALVMFKCDDENLRAGALDVKADLE
jgi:hypothetical protein